MPYSYWELSRQPLPEAGINRAACLLVRCTELARRGTQQGLFCRRQMSSAREFNNGGVTTKQRFDVREVLSNSCLVALALIVLVPLIMVVKDQCNDIVEAVDKPVGHGRIDKVVEPIVEIGKVMVSAVDFLQQRDVLPAKRFDLLP